MKNHLLMYNDIPVIQFDIENKNASILHKNLIPMCCKNTNNAWDCIRVFCANRILLMNREYCKEILTSCQIEDQSDINICVIGKALSFKDNYWIKAEKSNTKWAEVNLYNNEFSREIAYTSLTGETTSVQIGDKLYTGELTTLGTRAKCSERREDGIYLLKVETLKEIFAEVYGWLLVKALGLPYVEYNYEKRDNLDLSVTKIHTNLQTELVSARDIVLSTGSEMKCDSAYYELFLKQDIENFMKMQILDYIVLNTDRNRDNFGLLRSKGNLGGLFPIYDLDSFFKGKNVSAYYFVSGLSFENTIVYLQKEYPSYFDKALIDVKNLYDFIDKPDFRNDFIFTFDKELYDNMLMRTEKLFR